MEDRYIEVGKSEDIERKQQKTDRQKMGIYQTDLLHSVHCRRCPQTVIQVRRLIDKLTDSRQLRAAENVKCGLYSAQKEVIYIGAFLCKGFNNVDV